MFETSADAEEAFYAAFSVGRLDDMMRVWAPTPDVICIHPGGPRLVGIPDVRRSWAQIFQGSMLRTFTLRGRIVSGDEAQRIHVLEENIRLPGTNFVAPPVLATNIYQRLAQGWFIVLHHASVAPTNLSQTAPDTAQPGKPNPRLH
jgi:ketosteroid isomerase-like protein